MMMSRRDRDDRRIVVGVDGSPSSMAALRWAILQAELTGCAVEAVTAWRLPSRYGFAPVTDGARDFEGDARKILADALNEVKQRGTRCGLPLIVVEGHTAEVLVRAALRGGHAGGGQPGIWRIHWGAARLGQPVLRASCPLSCPGHPRDRLGRAMTSTVVNFRPRSSKPGSAAGLRWTWARPYAAARHAARRRAPRARARGRAPAGVQGNRLPRLRNVCTRSRAVSPRLLRRSVSSAHGLEDLPATEPGQRRAAQADRKAYDLLLVAELRPTPAQPDEGHPGTPDRLPRAVTYSQASPGQWGSRQGRGAGGQRAAPGPGRPAGPAAAAA